MFALLAVLVGCGDKDHDEGPNCSELSEACHEAEENGVEGAAECHDIAHDADEDACEEALADCLATCAE